MDFAKSTTHPSANAPHYLSARSADALISDLRPASLATPALHALNALLDELLAGLLRNAQSVDPEDVKLRGVPGVFGGWRASEEGAAGGRGGRALGRDAVGEAEVELRAWRDGQRAGAVATSGFGRFPRGVKTGSEEAFPVDEAVTMLRCKIMGLSTLAVTPGPPHVDKAATEAWARAGGATSEQVIAPAALYLTAIIEHVCEHILVHIGRVISRESSRRVATLQDLYVALCEDEGAWDMFRRMEVKRDMEDALRASGHASVVVGATARTAEPHAAETAAQDRVPVVATPSGGIRPAVQQTHSHSRKASTGSTTLGTGGAGVVRASGVERDRSGTASPVAGGPERHARSGSVLSASTRGMLGAYDDSRTSFSGGGGGAARRSVDTQGERTVPTDEFDQLVKSGQTVRVSLTPSRLKTFDSSGSLVAASKQSSPAKASALARKASLAKSPPRNTAAATANPGSPSASTKGASASPPRSIKPPGSASASRLIPKDAAAEESDTENIGYGKPSGKAKESLIDVLSADPPWGAAAGRAPPPKGPRQVPAVVVGAGPSSAPLPLGPPVSAALERTTSKNRLTPRSPTISPDQDELPKESVPPSKTPTQELADFFMSEPPPPMPASSDLSRQESIEAGRNHPGSKPKGFRKMMDRLTGKSPSSGNLRNDYSNKSSSAGQALQPKTSMASFTSADVAPPSYRPVQVPPEQSNRSNPVTWQLAAATAARPSASPREDSPDKLSQTAVPSSRPTQTQERSYLQASRPAPSVPNGSPSGQVRAEVSHKAELQDVRDKDAELSGRKTGVPAAVADGAVVAGAAVLTGLGINHHKRKVDDDGGRSTEVQPQSAENHQVSSTEDPAHSTIPDSGVAVNSVARGHAAGQEIAPEPATAPIGTANTSAISLAQLDGLRSILAHATSADECRMLVEAMLSQWRVPRTQGGTDGSSGIEVSPEAKITAWLLSGREGPPTGVSV